MRPRLELAVDEPPIDWFALSPIIGFNAATARSPWRTWHTLRACELNRERFNAATARSPWRTALAGLQVATDGRASMRPRLARRGD